MNEYPERRARLIRVRRSIRDIEATHGS